MDDFFKFFFSLGENFFGSFFQDLTLKNDTNQLTNLEKIDEELEEQIALH